MKILLVQDSNWIARNPVQHNHLIERLVLKGHKARIIDYDILWPSEKNRRLLSSRQIFSVSRLLQNAGHTVIRPRIIQIPVLDYFSMLFTYTFEIFRQIDEFKPDVLYLDTILSAYLASRLAKLKNIKIIYYCIDTCYRLLPYKFLQSLGKLIESRTIKAADLVFSINEKLREYTIRMGAQPSKTIVLRAGVDLDLFNPDICGREIRQKFGFEDDDKILFFAGWLYHFSGLKETAIQLAKVNDQKVKLFVVGDGDAYEDLRKIQINYRLDDRLVLAGKQPYSLLPQFFAAADICLLPAYDNEIMRNIVPIKLYEYMAMRKPVIATRLLGIITEFGEGNGIIYVDKPEDSIYRAIDLLRSQKEKETGFRARKFVEQSSWESITDRFEEILKEVVRKK